MKLWKTFGISSREDISYYDTAGEFEAERFCREPEPYDHGRNGRKRKRRRHVPLYRHRAALTGDSLGPLVGHKLRRQRLRSRCDRNSG